MTARLRPTFDPDHDPRLQWLDPRQLGLTQPDLSERFIVSRRNIDRMALMDSEIIRMTGGMILRANLQSTVARPLRRRKPLESALLTIAKVYENLDATARESGKGSQDRKKPSLV